MLLLAVVVEEGKQSGICCSGVVKTSLEPMLRRRDGQGGENSIYSLEHTVQHSTVQYSAELVRVVQCGTVQYRKINYSAAQYSIVQNN